MRNFPSHDAYKIHVQRGDGSPITRNKKQGRRGKARGVSLGPAENLKLRFPLLQLLYLPSFFTRKSPFWERLTQLRILFQDILGAETSISNLAARGVILIRPFPSGDWGLCWLNFIKKHVGGQRVRRSEVSSLQDRPPGGDWLSFCEIFPIPSSS